MEVGRETGRTDSQAELYRRARLSFSHFQRWKLQRVRGRFRKEHQFLRSRTWHIPSGWQNWTAGRQDAELSTPPEVQLQGWAEAGVGVEPRGAKAADGGWLGVRWVSGAKSPSRRLRPKAQSGRFREGVGATKAANWCRWDPFCRWAMRSSACAAMLSPWTESLRDTSLPARRACKAAFPVVTHGKITTSGPCRCTPSMMWLSYQPIYSCHSLESRFWLLSLALFFKAYGWYFSRPENFYMGPKYSSS